MLVQHEESGAEEHKAKVTPLAAGRQADRSGQYQRQAGKKAAGRNFPHLTESDSLFLNQSCRDDHEQINKCNYRGAQGGSGNASVSPVNDLKTYISNLKLTVFQITE